MRRAGPEWVAPKKTSSGRRIGFDIEAIFSLQTRLSNPCREAGSTLSARCGRPTGSDCRSGSGSASAGCSPRSPRRAAGACSRSRQSRLLVGAAVGYAIGGWHEAVAGGLARRARRSRRRGLRGRRARPRRDARRDGRARRPRRSVLAALALVPSVGYLEAVAASCGGRSRPARTAASATRACAAWRAIELAERKKLILIVIDGLTPEVFEDAVETGSRAGALVPRRGRQLPPRRLDLPVAHAGVPLLDRHRRTPRRTPHPAPRLVPPRRAAAGRVRLLVRGDPGRRDAPLDPRHDLQHERAAPRPRRRHRLRGARGRGADRRGRSTSPATAAAAAPAARPGTRSARPTARSGFSSTACSSRT